VILKGGLEWEILVERLAKAENEKKPVDKVRRLSKFQLLIIDEIGYLPFDELGAHCFFWLISRRYERASIIFTFNKSYGEWGYLQGSCYRSRDSG
jgi:DNA replication protein DnaC